MYMFILNKSFSIKYTDTCLCGIIKFCVSSKIYFFVFMSSNNITSVPYGVAKNHVK